VVDSSVSRDIGNDDKAQQIRQGAKTLFAFFRCLPFPSCFAYNAGMADALGLFEQAVLLSLVRLGKEAYGRRILDDIERRLERPVTAGALYSTLDRLEAKGLVSSQLAAGTPVRGGRPRRYYTLNALGSAALNRARAAIDGIWQGVAVPLGGPT